MKRPLHVAHSLDQEPLHPLSTLVDTDVIYVKKGPSLPPLFLHIASDHKQVGRPGNEAERAAQHVLPTVTGATKNQILVDNSADQHSNTNLTRCMYAKRSLTYVRHICI